MRRLLLILTVTLALVARARGADTELKLLRTIPLDGVEGRIDHMAISVDGRQLFVAALGNNSVEVIDTARGVRTGRIQGIREPQGLFHIAETGRLAVACGGDDNLRIYDKELRLIGTVGDLEDADNVRYDARSKLLYVGYGHGGLAAIDPNKITRVADIKLDAHPESFQLESRGSRIFVNVPGSGKIEVVDRSNNKVVAKWPLTAAEANFRMVLDEEHHRLFVGCRNPSQMLAIDSDTGKAVAVTRCVGDTDDLFFDSARKRIYASGGAGSINVIEQVDADHYRVIENIKTAAGARTSFFSTATAELYLAVPRGREQAAEIRVYQVAG